MSNYIISGIQQIGIGVPNVHEAWNWYRKHFGMDLKMFEEAAEAKLMLPYTGGEPRSRHAILAVNLQGGGGFEIWQYTSRVPQPAAFVPQLGDLGIYIAKIKSKDVTHAYNTLKNNGVEFISALTTDPKGDKTALLKDPYGNIFQLVKGQEFYKELGHATGGPSGVIIGVSNIEKALPMYQQLLGYDTIVYDKTGVFEDFAGLENGSASTRRVLLRHKAPRKGSFSKVFGSTEIELVCTEGTEKRKIFENRFWGDLGYIHLCFDINGMAALKAKSESLGHPFTVDSANSFDMGEAAGHFTYIEDADGALIEFVETHKIPILKAVGWYLDLRKRNPEKPLPDFMFSALSITRTKD